MSVGIGFQPPPRGPGAIATGLFDNDPHYSSIIKVRDPRSERVYEGQVDLQIASLMIGQQERAGYVLLSCRVSGIENINFYPSLCEALIKEGFLILQNAPEALGSIKTDQILLCLRPGFGETSQTLASSVIDKLESLNDAAVSFIDSRARIASSKKFEQKVKDITSLENEVKKKLAEIFNDTDGASKSGAIVNEFFMRLRSILENSKTTGTQSYLDSNSTSADSMLAEFTEDPFNLTPPDDELDFDDLDGPAID